MLDILKGLNLLTRQAGHGVIEGVPPIVNMHIFTGQAGIPSEFDIKS